MLVATHTVTWPATYGYRPRHIWLQVQESAMLLIRQLHSLLAGQQHGAAAALSRLLNYPPLPTSTAPARTVRRRGWLGAGPPHLVPPSGEEWHGRVGPTMVTDPGFTASLRWQLVYLLCISW